MKQKEYRTVRITRHMRAGMLAAGLLLPLVAGAATSGGMLIPFEINNPQQTCDLTFDNGSTMMTYQLGAMSKGSRIRHCCKVSDEAAFCLIQRPYISKTLLTRRISPRGSP